MIVDGNAWRLNGGLINFTWRGVLLGPGVIKHEKLTGRDDHPGLQVLRCVICGKPGWRGERRMSAPLGVRIVEQLVRPGWTDEYRDTLTWQVVFAESEPPAVVGWVTSCGHVVWGGDWELCFPGPNRIPRWENRLIPEKERDAARYAAFARGEE